MGGGRVLHGIHGRTRRGTIHEAGDGVRAAVVWVSRGGHLSSEVCADSITREKERQTERTPSAKQRQGR